MPRKINILYVISSLVNQGPVQELYEIISHIDFTKHNVTVFTLGKENQNSLIDLFSRLPIKIMQNEKAGRLSFIKFFKGIKKIAIRDNIDIIHSQCFRSLILVSFFRNNYICFHSIYVYPGIQSKSINGKMIGTFTNMITKFLIRRIHYPIACAKNVSDDLLRNDRIKVQYIRNGVSPLKRPNKEKKEFKELVGLPTDQRYFISIGRLSPEKNFSTLIKAFNMANLNGFKLIIIGDGILREELEASSGGNIIFTGFKSNIGDYLAASDVYITTSKTEGIALSTIYAMSSSLPLLLSDIPSHREIFDLAGKETEIGFLFKNEDIEGIVKVISEMAASVNYKKMSLNTLAIYNDFLTGMKMSSSYQQLYKNCLNLK